jgi:hypothetical protein
MGFALEENESFAVAIRRIAVEQIDMALDRLEHASGDVSESVHATRQSLKRIRALLALARGELGNKVFKNEWNCYRNVAGLLAGGRDAAAAVDILETLIRRFPCELAPDAFGSERRFLAERRDTLIRVMIEGDGVLLNASEIVSAARERVATWPVRCAGFDAVRKGLRRSYRSGRQGFRTVIRHPTSTNFHEWRGPVKMLWHQLQILTPIWPAMMKAHAHELRVLSDHLNENHDLDGLRNILLQAPPEARSREGQSPDGFVQRRCYELEVKALQLGERLYTERPRHFAGRIESYWRTWQLWNRDAAAISISSPALPLPAISPSVSKVREAWLR